MDQGLSNNIDSDRYLLNLGSIHELALSYADATFFGSRRVEPAQLPKKKVNQNHLMSRPCWAVLSMSLCFLIFASSRLSIAFVKPYKRFWRFFL